MENEFLQDAKEWYSFAEADLIVAKHLLETCHPLQLAIICYHCQQSAEKSVKSIIMLHGSPGGLPKLHDILMLLNQIKNYETIGEELYEYADILNPYGVEIRYPHELYLEERHARKAVEMAAKYLEWANHIISDAVVEGEDKQE